MEVVEIIALRMGGDAWVSGLNLYAQILFKAGSAAQVTCSAITTENLW